MKRSPTHASHPKSSAKNVRGDFGEFTTFMKRLVKVPHSEIKARLDAEKREKKKPASLASSGTG